MKIIFKCIGLLKKIPVPWHRGSLIEVSGISRTHNLLNSVQDSIDILSTRVDALQKEIEEMQLEMQNGFTIDKYIVERMNVDKFELNVEAIDVEEVSGALNVGITHNSIVHKGKSKGTTPSLQNVKQQTAKKENNEHSPINKINNDSNKNYTITFHPHGSVPKRKSDTY